MIDFRKIRATLRELKRVYCLINDDSERKYFEQYFTINAIVNCKNVIALSSWLRANVDDKMLSDVFENALMQEEKYVLGPLYLLMRGLNPNERVLFVKALRQMREHGCFHFGYESFENMIDETEHFHQESNNGILLFRGTLGCYMAVGKSADLIYEELGWQPAVNHYANDSSCMFLCDYSPLIVGKVLEYKVSRQELDFDHIFLDDEGETCLEFSLQQQMMDYYRFLADYDEIHLPTCGLADICVEEDGVKEDIQFPFIQVSGSSICMFNAMAQNYLVVSGHSWMLSPEDLPLANRLADLLYMDLSLSDIKSESFGQRYRIHGEKCCDAFFDVKDRYQDSFLMADYHGVVESYGDDAVWLAWHYKMPLWCRSDPETGVSPMVIIPPEKVTKILEDEPKAVLEAIDIDDSVDRMALWPNSLNNGLQDTTEYKNPRVYKRKDGKCVVTASLNGKSLPQRILKDEMVSLYERYPEGVMKKAVLKLILWYVYTLKEDRKRR